MEKRSAWLFQFRRGAKLTLCNVQKMSWNKSKRKVFLMHLLLGVNVWNLHDTSYQTNLGLDQRKVAKDLIILRWLNIHHFCWMCWYKKIHIWLLVLFLLKRKFMRELEVVCHYCIYYRDWVCGMLWGRYLWVMTAEL